MGITDEEIAALELLAVELQLSRAVSVASVSVTAPERDRPVSLPERTILRDRSLVDNDAPRSSFGEAWLLGFAIRARRQSELEVSARQILARGQDAADPVLGVCKKHVAE
jgi:hypothetical protein